MYFDFEDYHPDISPVGRAISWREGVLLSIIFHLMMVILVLVAPKWFPFLANPGRPRLALVQPPPPDPTRFVFVQPRFERQVPKAPDRADSSDRDRIARAPERAERPRNPLPFARGNSPERAEELQRQAARGQEPQPDPAAGHPTETAAPDADTPEAPESPSQPQPPLAPPPAAQARPQ